MVGVAEMVEIAEQGYEGLGGYELLAVRCDDSKRYFQEGYSVFYRHFPSRFQHSA